MDSFGSWLLRLTVCTLALCGLVDIFSRMMPWLGGLSYNDYPDCWCGSSDADAIAMGCTYDHIAVDWLPSSCNDPELVKEFDAAGPNPDGSWTYYELRTTKWPERSFIPVNSSDIDTFAIEGRNYYTTREWHILHCLFVWRKQVRAYHGKLSIEPWNDEEEHVRHCSDYIMTAIRLKLDKDDIDTLIPGVDRH